MRLFRVAKVIFMVSVVTSGCVDQNDPHQAARDYCQCLKKHNALKDYATALVICEGKMVEKYRYYRISIVDLKFDWMYDKLSKATIDSTKEFMNKFDLYKNKNCEEEKPYKWKQ